MWTEDIEKKFHIDVPYTVTKIYIKQHKENLNKYNFIDYFSFSARSAIRTRTCTCVWYYSFLDEWVQNRQRWIIFLHIVLQLVWFQVYGHHMASLDPLDLNKINLDVSTPPELSLTHYNIGKAGALRVMQSKHTSPHLFMFCYLSMSLLLLKVLCNVLFCSPININVFLKTLDGSTVILMFSQIL